MNRTAQIAKFFANYPTEAVYDNDEECKERLRTMTDCVRAVRALAVENGSLKELQEVHVMEHDLSMIYALLMQRRQRSPLLT